MKKHHFIGAAGLIGILIIGSIIMFKKNTHASLVTLEPTIPVITEDDMVTSVQEIDEKDATSTITTVVITSSTLSNDEFIDSDHDGLSDATERKLGTDPENSDTDSDSYLDGEELDHGYNPLNPKPDRSTIVRSMEVDLDHQQMYYLVNKVIIHSFPVSTGLLGRETPRGTFTIFRKLPVADYRGPDYFLPQVKWNLEFKPKYFIHGTYWHDNFGIQAMSHGCINVSVENAKKIYDFLQIGDKVTIYGKTPVGKVSS